ncbi:hypothetical protein BGP77_05100 [Saccharospirillum sp. MSK14-1]|uniref:DUF2970 domain-containing protein n=1 Tax=Saccharospirillum sp. MSK14-1 TaxID=1897632 RepID=UPI000D3CDFFB|nr:DUF2970 domain-containing protein [Saccharospirillum sp. MSK14-1]PTY36671.1 hypothetical protein BGP77_05100 [Saccharospirillum sp. MSK14-1]
MVENRASRAESRLSRLWRLILSLLAGLVGVQSDKNRVSDFHSTSIWPFIIGGILMTAVFVLALILLVRTLAP